MNGRVDDILDVLTSCDVIDLSRTLEENIPSVPTHAKFGRAVYESYDYGDIALHSRLTLSEHTGTHMDAPSHFIREGKAHYGIDQVALEKVFGRAAFIDASDLPANDLLTADRLQDWERENGELRTGDIVLIRFGWDSLWGVKPEGSGFLKDWPGLGQDAAEYLVEKGAYAVGTDAMAIDSYSAQDYPAHYTLLGNEVLIIENLNNLSQLPPFSLFLAFPLKVKDGSASPVRAVAFVPK